MGTRHVALSVLGLGLVLVAIASVGRLNQWLTLRPVDTQPPPNIDLPRSFEPIPFRATCGNTEAGSRTWEMAYDGKGSFISRAYQPGDAMPEEIVSVRGQEHTRWVRSLAMADVYEYSAAVPDELDVPRLGDSTAVNSRLKGFSNLPVFTVAELREAMVSRQIELVSSEYLHGRPVLRFRVEHGDGSNTETLVHATHGIRLDAVRRSADGVVEMNWQCRSLDVSIPIPSDTFSIEFPSDTLVRESRIVALDSGAGHTILIRHHVAASDVAIPNHNGTVLEMRQYRQDLTGPYREGWAVVYSLPNALVVFAPENGDSPVSGSAVWSEASRFRSATREDVADSTAGAIATWINDGTRVLVRGRNVAAVHSIVSTIEANNPD